MGLEGLSHQAVVRIDPHVTEAGLVGFILRTLYLLLAQSIGLGHARLDFLLHIQSHFQCQRSDTLHQQGTDCFI